MLFCETPAELRVELTASLQQHEDDDGCLNRLRLPDFSLDLLRKRSASGAYYDASKHLPLFQSAMNRKVASGSGPYPPQPLHHKIEIDAIWIVFPHTLPNLWN